MAEDKGGKRREKVREKGTRSLKHRLRPSGRVTRSSPRGSRPPRISGAGKAAGREESTWTVRSFPHWERVLPPRSGPKGYLGTRSVRSSLRRSASRGRRGGRRPAGKLQRPGRPYAGPIVSGST